MSAAATMTLAQAPSDGRDGSAFAACLEPLLEALQWRGTARQRVEATVRDCTDVFDLRNTMANLDFVNTAEPARLGDLDVRLLPCLFVPFEGAPLVVLEAGKTPGRLSCFDGVAGRVVEVTDLDRSGDVYYFSLDEGQIEVSDKPRGGWFRSIIARFESTFAQLLGLSFFLSVLAVLPAFFVLAIYDRVLTTRDYSTLGYFTSGIFFVLLCDAALRVVRGAILARVGARLDYIIGSSAVRKMLSLPLAKLDMTSVGSQISKLREFDGLRTAFTGPAVLSLLELPFVFVFMLAIAAIGGWLALLPVGLAFVMIAAGFLAVRYAREAANRSTRAFDDQQSLVVEIIVNAQAIKAGAAETVWIERFRERSAQTAFVNLRQARIAALADNFAYGINQVAGAATLAVGAMIALGGGLSVGALIASMTLVWRMLGPLQSLFVALTRSKEVAGAIRGIDQLMGMPSEGQNDRAATRTARGRKFAGRIALDRVMLRYAPHHEPAIAGISVDFKPGQVVAITGGNGSGKSTLLKLMAGLYQPQVGTVTIDGVDIRQVNPLDLRQSMAYLPQQSELFSGSIASNLLITNPGATDDDLRMAAAKAGVLAEVDALPAGFATAADDQLSASLIRGIVLARCYLADSSIVLLDEPGVAVDAAGRDLLIPQLDAMRGRSTVLFVTHHPAHILVADRVIVLRQGAIVHDGVPKALMTKLAQGAK